MRDQLHKLEQYYFYPTHVTLDNQLTNYVYPNESICTLHYRNNYIDLTVPNAINRSILLIDKALHNSMNKR